MSARIAANLGYAKMLAAAREEGGRDLESVTMRRLSKTDLFFLIVHVLGRDDVDRDWLFDRCWEVEANPDGYLDLWARAHYKSTIITFGLTIQNILCDPNITVGIFSHTRPIAKSFIRQIKREFESNRALIALFPDVLWDSPARQASKWSEDDGIIVKRTSNPKEATLEAWGLVDGQPTSRHFDLMVYDDVVTRESVTTPEMIKKTTEAWELSLNLASENGRSRYIGTRYHFNDTYHDIMERQSAIARTYRATMDGTVNGEPVLLTRDQIAQKRRDMGPFTFAAQMMQDPTADATQGFDHNWIKFWDADSTYGMNLYILCDPAHSKKKDSDYTSFHVIGLSSDQNYYIATMVRDRLNLTERANMLFALHKEYRPLGVGYERYGLQSDIEHFEDRMNRENYRFTVTELGGQMSKIDRIRRLIPIFEQGRVYLPRTCHRRNYEGVSVDLTKDFIHQEYRPFPVGHHDDMLDCMARILDPDMHPTWPIESGSKWQDRLRHMRGGQHTSPMAQ